MANFDVEREVRDLYDIPKNSKTRILSFLMYTIRMKKKKKGIRVCAFVINRQLQIIVQLIGAIVKYDANEINVITILPFDMNNSVALHIKWLHILRLINDAVKYAAYVVNSKNLFYYLLFQWNVSVRY